MATDSDNDLTTAAPLAAASYGVFEQTLGWSLSGHVPMHSTAPTSTVHTVPERDREQESPLPTTSVQPGAVAVPGIHPPPQAMGDSSSTAALPFPDDTTTTTPMVTAQLVNDEEIRQAITAQATRANIVELDNN